MKLISMIEFVKKMNNSESKGINALIVEYAKIVDYAKFLEQPITLAMFIPCKDGNVLRKPNYYESFLNNYYLDKPNLIDYESCHAYKKAEDMILFEGFVNVDTRMKGRNQVRLLNANVSGSSDTIQNDFAGLYFHNSFNEKSRLKTIEDLLNFHPLELTESAIEKVGI